MNDNKLSPEETAYLSFIILSIIFMIIALKFLSGAARPPKQMETTHISKDLPNYMQEEYCYMLLRYGMEDAHILTYAEERLICRCIMREAGGESDEGQQAVATVIFNRYFSPKFPNSINEIIVPGQFEVCDSYEDVTQQVKINLQRAIIDYGTQCQIIPYNCYYFRADKYHDFGIPYMQIGNNYFSLSEEATD